MLKNLKAELVRNGYDYKNIQEILSCSEKTARNKIQGITDFTYSEAEKIRNVLFPQLTMEYLFSRDSKRISINNSAY